MRIAITGAGGQLGQALGRALGADHEVVALGRAELELGQPDATARLVATGAELVVHPAAYTNVDGCAREPERAYQINALGTKQVALACQQLGAPLVYVSTNEVFGGHKGSPYYEYDQAAPINPYGWSKWCGEQAVRELLQRFYIVRVAWLFGGEREQLAMVSDEIGSPTYAPDAAEGIARLIDTGAYGTYHMVNQGFCSRYELAAEVLRRAGREGVRLVPMRLADFKRDSVVPAYTPLHNAAGAAAGVVLRPWQEAVAEYVQGL